MRRKFYTIIISPSNLKPSKQFTIHCPILWFAICAFLIFITYGILGSLKFYEKNRLYAEYLQIKKEKSDLEQANKIVAQIRKKEILIRKFLGLDNDNVQVPGQGGPNSSDSGLGEYQYYKKTFPASSEPVTLENNQFLSPYLETVLLDRDLQEIIEFLNNQKEELAKLPTISPIADLESWVTSGFGMRKSPFTGFREFHSGLDIFAPRGTPIMATGNGRVCFAGINGGLGKMVRIEHNDRCETVYGHLSGYNVEENQIVKRADIIGFVGNTGNSTGYHLHYEIQKDGKPVDPFPYLLNWDDRYFLACRNNASLE